MSFWKKLGGFLSKGIKAIAKVAGKVVSTVIPGVGPLVGNAIEALGNTASGALERGVQAGGKKLENLARGKGGQRRKPPPTTGSRGAALVTASTVVPRASISSPMRAPSGQTAGLASSVALFGLKKAVQTTLKLAKMPTTAAVVGGGAGVAALAFRLLAPRVFRKVPVIGKLV